MTRRRGVLILLVTTVLASCSASRSGPDAGDLAAIVTASRRVPRSIELQRTTEGRRWEVSGRFSDDHRYAAALRADGVAVLEEIDLDDDRYVRVLAPDLLALLGAGTAIDPAASAGWVRDAGGPLPDLPRSETRRRALDPALLGGDLHLLEQLPERLRPARRWNPDAADYLAANDRFPPHAADGDRFDVPTSQYDGDVLFRDGVPNDLARALERHFLHVSVWVREGRVRRVEMLYDPDLVAVQRDLARARARDASRVSGTPAARDIALAPASRTTAVFEYPPAVSIQPPAPAPTVRFPELPGPTQ